MNDAVMVVMVTQAIGAGLVSLLLVGFIILPIRARLAGLIVDLAGLPVWALRYLYDLLLGGIGAASRLAAASYQAVVAAGGAGTRPLFAILGPQLYLAQFLILLAGDLPLTSLRLASLLLPGAKVSPELARLHIEVLSGVQFTATMVLIGMLLAELLGVSPYRLWHTLNRPVRLGLLATTLGALIVMLVANLALFLSTQALSIELEWADMTWLFIKCFAILVVLSATVAGGPLLASLGGFALAALAALTGALHALRAVLGVLIIVVVKLASILVSIVDVSTAVPERLWDWLVSFEWAERLHLGPSSREPLQRPDEHWLLDRHQLSLPPAGSHPGVPDDRAAVTAEPSPRS